MTLRELCEKLLALPAEHADLEVKVWLPGSKISLSGVCVGLQYAKGLGDPGMILLEGNVDEGSALG